MERTAEPVQEASKVTLDDIDWDYEMKKLQCSLDNPESCEMCQG